MPETICPFPTAKSTLLTAVSPPNRMVRPRTSRIGVSGIGFLLVELPLESPRRKDALGPEPHHENERQAEDDQLDVGEPEVRTRLLHPFVEPRGQDELVPQ